MGPRKNRENQYIGPTVKSAKRSARSMPRIFGTCSPMTMWKKVMTKKAMTEAMAARTPRVKYAPSGAGKDEARRSNCGASISESVDSPIQPRARDESVTPSCVAEKKATRVSLKASTRRARRSPVSASEAKRIRRTLTTANSVVTKKPLAKTSRRTARILRNVSILAQVRAAAGPRSNLRQLVLNAWSLCTQAYGLAPRRRKPGGKAKVKRQKRRDKKERGSHHLMIDESRAVRPRPLLFCLAVFLFTFALAKPASGRTRRRGSRPSAGLRAGRRRR